METLTEKFRPSSLRLFVFRPYSQPLAAARSFLFAPLRVHVHGRLLLFYFARTSSLRSTRARAQIESGNCEIRA